RRRRAARASGTGSRPAPRPGGAGPSATSATPRSGRGATARSAEPPRPPNELTWGKLTREAGVELSGSRHVRGLTLRTSAVCLFTLAVALAAGCASPPTVAKAPAPGGAAPAPDEPPPVFALAATLGEDDDEEGVRSRITKVTVYSD